MKAVCWHGTHDVRVENVPDPKILNPRDAIVRITSTAICGSDLHLYDGYIPTMEKGDILGHESMGEVRRGRQRGQEPEEGRPRGRAVHDLLRRCFFCEKRHVVAVRQLEPERRDRRERCTAIAGRPVRLLAHATAATPAGRREYVRVPFADVGPIKIPDGMPDEQVLFLSDIFPTGYMAAENCNIEPGDTVAVWGCGPVGQFAIRAPSCSAPSG